MSHASVIVAPLKKTIQAHGIKQALVWEMKPFDENEEWFRDGSRWDWYVVGGRFTGLLTGYDPYTDPANMVTCDLCDGTGTRPGGKEQFGEDWLKQCGGCNGCRGTGRCLADRFPPYPGDILHVSALDTSKFKPAYAFLRNRHWHEGERLGWFGTTTYTECELKDMKKPAADPEKWVQKCLHKDEATGARVICWNEPDEIWNQNFFPRFIQPLTPDDTLILVDYHV